MRVIALIDDPGVVHRAGDLVDVLCARARGPDGGKFDLAVRNNQLHVRAATAPVWAAPAAGGASRRGLLPRGCAPAAAIPSGLRACRNPRRGSACSALSHGRPADSWLPPARPEGSVSAPQRAQTQEPPGQSRASGSQSSRQNLTPMPRACRCRHARSCRRHPRGHALGRPAADREAARVVHFSFE